MVRSMVRSGGLSHVVETHRPADDVRIGPEPAPPEPVADHRLRSADVILAEGAPERAPAVPGHSANVRAETPR